MKFKACKIVFRDLEFKVPLRSGLRSNTDTDTNGISASTINNQLHTDLRLPLRLVLLM